MSNRNQDILFQLIHSLEKAEKRHFKLYIKRSSANEELKIVQLFDVLDKLDEYDEKRLLKKLPGIEKPQLSNLKTHLYKQLLASLRLLKSAESIDLQLNEQFDYAHILYKKGLFLQSLRILEKARETAKAHQKFNFLIQVISLEKRIETLHITRSMQGKSRQLAREAIEVSEHVNMVARLSNLALQLFSWYIQYGHARNHKDETAVVEFFNQNLPTGAENVNGFFEKLYLYQSYCLQAFIRQNFLLYYRYAQKWVNLFETEPFMIRVETGNYIKGVHNLLNAHFDLKNYSGLSKTLKQFEAFSTTERVIKHDNFKIQTFIYIHSAKINQHFIHGTFKDGLSLVPYIEEKLQEYSLFLDPHRILVFNYKIATLYFGSEDYKTCIGYLHRIINENIDLRYDLQCYARLMHLLAHYELGNFELMDPLVRSVYRFFSKMQNFTVVEEEIFRFLRKSSYIKKGQIKIELEKFLNKIKQFETSRYETRSFAYIDIISWVESKVYGKKLSQVIREKYLTSKRR